MLSRAKVLNQCSNWQPPAQDSHRVGGKSRAWATAGCPGAAAGLGSSCVRRQNRFTPTVAPEMNSSR